MTLSTKVLKEGTEKINSLCQEGPGRSQVTRGLALVPDAIHHRHKSTRHKSSALRRLQQEGHEFKASLSTE